MDPKNFIWIHHLSIYPYKFNFNFWSFKTSFWRFKMILAFSGIIFELKMIYLKSRN